MTLIPLLSLQNYKQPLMVVFAEILFKGTRKSYNMPMIIDTGTTRTALPLRVLIEELNAHPVDYIQCRGYNDIAYSHPLFVVNILVVGNTHHNMEVIGIPKDGYGLLGMDIISRYELLFNGPKQVFELELHE